LPALTKSSDFATDSPNASDKKHARTHKNYKKLGLKVGFLLGKKKGTKKKAIKFRHGRNFVLTCLTVQRIR